MTKLEAVRAAIIKAVPEILCGDCQGAGFTVQPSMPDGEPEQIQCNCQERPIRLVDIARALAKTNFEGSQYLAMKSKQWTDICVLYRLGDDGLSQQSEECIEFLHSFLCV